MYNYTIKEGKTIIHTVKGLRNAKNALNNIICCGKYDKQWFEWGILQNRIIAKSEKITLIAERGKKCLTTTSLKTASS